MAHLIQILWAVYLVVISVEGHDVTRWGKEFTGDSIIIQTAAHSSRHLYKSYCPCAFENPYLHCENRSFSLTPADCFSMYSDIDTIDLSQNILTEILENDFDAAASSVTVINLSSNWIAYIHPYAFSDLLSLTKLDLSHNPLIRLPDFMLHNNAKLNYLDLQYGQLLDLPTSLFSPNMHNVSIFVHPNNCWSIPCAFISSVPVVISQDLYNFTLFWASSDEEMNSCQSFGLPIYTTNCRPYGALGIDCSVLLEPMTPQKASMALSESANYYYHAIDITFKAELDRLVGVAPDSFDCVPPEFDMTKAYRLYYRQSSDFVIESIFFDLLDLPVYTSAVTKSVMIRADTVVLTGPLQPLQYYLTIVARRVVLEYPILMNANITTYAPDVDFQFYTAFHERGRVGNVVAEKLQHGFVKVLLLQGEIDLNNSCQPLSDWTTETEDWVEPSQLWLSLYCASALIEKGKIPKYLQAEEMAHFVANITRDWTKTGHIGVNQKAIKVLQDVNMQSYGYHRRHDVPYLTVSVYAEMVSYLNENLLLYSEAMNRLKLKLEVNAQRMFDYTVGFSERMNDLNFLKANAEDAVDKAQAVLEAHSHQLKTLYQQTSVIWNNIVDVYNQLNNTKGEVEAAQTRVEEGMEAYKKRRRFLSILDFSVLVVDITLAVFNPLLLEKAIMDITLAVAEFILVFEGREQDIAQMAAAVDELMDYVDAIISLAPSVPPGEEDMIDWLQHFKDTEEIVKVATNFSASKSQWEGIREACMIALDDEELSDAVDGVRQLKMAIFDLTVHGQTLSEHMIIFSNLVISVNEQISIVNDETIAVNNSQEALSEALALINDVILTEQNYREYMFSQNIALAKVMAQLYLRSRSDMLAAFNVLGDYCNAFFFTFLKDCPIKASYTDDYSTMIYKLQQVDVLGLNSIGSIAPPPQPFQMTFDIEDNMDKIFCQRLTDKRCLVSQLAQTGRTSVTLSDWWGIELDYTDRVRIDSLRFYLMGIKEPQVTLAVARPSLFNDTWQGETFEFAGHVTSCLIIYEDSTFQGPDDANFITDCSTHQLYDEYYYRSTPYGTFGIEWSEFELGKNYTELLSIKVIAEGSWVPRV